jgi:hypothetical protein
MRVWTSYYAKVGMLPEGCVPISISLGCPKELNVRKYLAFAPTWAILNDYKRTGDAGAYVRRFYGSVLANASVEDFMDFARRCAAEEGKPDADIVLLCYERPSAFCHRHLVARWLTAHGVPCDELDVR